MIVSIPSFSISNTTRTIGPATITHIWNKVVGSIAVSSVSVPLWISLESSPDGTVWTRILRFDVTSPGIDKTGTPNTTIDFVLHFPSASFSIGSRIRAILECPGNFSSSGGTLTVT